MKTGKYIQMLATIIAGVTLLVLIISIVPEVKTYFEYREFKLLEEYVLLAGVAKARIGAGFMAIIDVLLKWLLVYGVGEILKGKE